MEVNLEVFSGPLDLLLKLIRKKEIDIYDIPIAQITEEYLEAIEGITPDMGEMSEFLVLAATLLEIKSNMLLPKPSTESAQDPREALVERLIAYEEAQCFAKILTEIEAAGEIYTGRGEPELMEMLAPGGENEPIKGMLPIAQLVSLFGRLMQLRAERIDIVRSGYGEMSKERFTVANKIGLIMESLNEKGRVSLFSLFGSCVARGELVVTFLALLELVRRGRIRAVQERAFGDVEMLPCPA